MNGRSRLSEPVTLLPDHCEHVVKCQQDHHQPVEPGEAPPEHEKPQILLQPCRQWPGANEREQHQHDEELEQHPAPQLAGLEDHAGQ